MWKTRLCQEIVSKVFEDDHVMGIETYGSMVFSSMKHILNDVHDTDVSVVTLLRKQRPKGRNIFWKPTLQPLLNPRLFSHRYETRDTGHLSVSSMRSSRMIKCFSLGSMGSKTGNPWTNSTPSTVPYKVWYSP
jgi:hypothetical protein